MKEYIDRAKYRERLSNLESWCQDLRNPGLTQALQMFDEIPAADVVPVVHGRWNVIEGRRLDNAICSNCGRRFQAYYGAYSFCPNCGAKMDGGESDEGD